LGILGDLANGLEANLEASCDGSLGKPLGQSALDGGSGFGAEASGAGLWGEGLVAVFAAASGGSGAVGAVFDDGFGLVAVRAGNGMKDHGNLARQESCQEQRD
jgi:hypothetical protein